MSDLIQKKMLRFATAGSVDDGKSTLIGRLLFDSKALFDDQLEALKQSSVKKGLNFVDLSLATDGLRAEREQGITIDVAYRYFATPVRKFIIADTPGHIQYTRNMITGASTADAMIVLVDGRKGILEQTRRHTYIASLLRVPHLIVCVNKMDLLDWDRMSYEAIITDLRSFIGTMHFEGVHFIPISALEGDNIVDASSKMNWYQGPTVLQLLETLELVEESDKAVARFPVQAVIRPRPNEIDDHRHYAGRLSGGSLCVGEEVVVLPSELKSTVLRAMVGFESVYRIEPGVSASLELADEIDVSRGDIIVPVAGLPRSGKEIEAEICWLHTRPSAPHGKLLLRQGSVQVKCMIQEVGYTVDVNTGERKDSIETIIQMNEIVGIRLKLAQPLHYDTYEENRSTGSFILIDEFTNDTVAAGMIR
jgi:sulfate adenylyltransferase subunit 1